jgi:hypothetical protein
MAEAKERLKQAKRRPATRSSAKAASPVKPAAKAKKESAPKEADKKAERPKWLRRRRQTECNGARAMLDCANQALDALSVSIVDKFATQAEAGNATSAKFLFDLVTTKKVTSRSKLKRLPEFIASVERETANQASDATVSQTASNQ